MINVIIPTLLVTTEQFSVFMLKFVNMNVL